MRRWGVAVVALLALAAAAPTAPPPDLPLVLAFTPHGLPGDTVEDRADPYGRLRELGVSAIRLDLEWTAVEPVGEPLHDYDFTALDREIAAITAAGLDVIGLLGYGHPDYSTVGGVVDDTTGGGGLPPFGVGSSHYVPPDDPGDFARYAAAVAAHYGDEIIAWEVWNEENEGWRFWFPHEDPAAYADLLCETAGALRRVDPETPVVFGGVFFPAVPPGLPGMSGPQFVSEAYAARPDVGDCYDVLAYHPYPYPFTAPELEVPIRGSVLSAAGAMRDALPPAERDTPLWITEIGWPTHAAYGVDEEKHGEYVARMTVATAAQRIPLLNWYTFGDFDDPTDANQEAHFGFFRADGTPKPAVAALTVFADLFGGTRSVRDRADELGLPEGQELVAGGGFAYEFAGSDRTVTALWYANESAAEEQGPLPAGGTLADDAVEVVLPVSRPRVDVVDHVGERRTVTATDGHIRLTLGPAPQYVVEAAARGDGDGGRPPLPVTGGGATALVGVVALVVASARRRR